MKPSDSQSIVEPFNLFGVNSTIWNREVARKVARDNSYYYFAISGLCFFVAALFPIMGWTLTFDAVFLVVYGVLLLPFAFLVRLKLSRVAAIILLINFLVVFVEGLLNYGSSEFPAISLLLAMIPFMASIRAVQATFAFHKLGSGK